MNKIAILFRFLLALLCLIPGVALYVVAYFMGAMVHMLTRGYRDGKE